MSTSISTTFTENYTPAATDTKNPQSSKEIDESFIEMLTNHFNNDNIKDAHDQGRKTIQNGKLATAAIFGFSEETTEAIEKNNKAITLKDLAWAVENDMSNFQAMFDEALNKAGIPKTPAFEIVSDSSGKLSITSDHPDKEKIEKILNEVPNIKQTYERVAANSLFIEEGKAYLKFLKSQELDPQSAIRQFTPIFEEIKSSIFSIFVDEDGYSRKMTSQETGENLITETINDNALNNKY